MPIWVYAWKQWIMISWWWRLAWLDHGGWSHDCHACILCWILIVQTHLADHTYSWKGSNVTLICFTGARLTCFRTCAMALFILNRIIHRFVKNSHSLVDHVDLPYNKLCLYSPCQFCAWKDCDYRAPAGDAQCSRCAKPVPWRKMLKLFLGIIHFQIIFTL